MPIAPTRSQAAHCPVQAVSQQTPSTQKPVPHSEAEPQLDPVVLAQLPAFVGVSQAAPLPQLASVQQTPSVQKPVPHSEAEPHLVPVVLAQLPAFVGVLHAAPLPQLAWAQQTPSVQKAPAGHLEASVQGSPSFGTGTHAPETHVKPAAQSEGAVQVVLHAAASQP